MHRIIKVSVVRLLQHIQRPSHLLALFILTLSKTFPDLLHCVYQDDVVVVHVVEIQSCRALPGEYLPVHIRHDKVVPLGFIYDRIISPDVSEV